MMLSVQTAAIVAKGPLPKPNDPRVLQLVESIGDVGLMNALTVVERDDSKWHLIAGRHRLVAQRVLKESTTDVNVLDLDELGSELATIDENLIRRILPALERAEQLKRRKEIYEAIHPETKHGAAPGKKGGKGGKASKVATVATFADDTADKTGVSARGVREYVRVAEQLDPHAKASIAGTAAADSITELTKLARLGPEKQRQVAAAVAKGKTVKAATRELLRAEQVAQVRAYVPPVGEFEVIVVDPSWPYEDSLDGSDEARGGTPYPQQTIAEIAAISLPVAKDCSVWLFVTNSHLVDPDAYAVVVRAWRERYGLKPRTLRTWRKPRMGLGRVLRNSTEHLVLLERGSPVYTGVTQTTDFTAPMGAHSEKPQEAFDDIVALCASPARIELFARKPRVGWESSGSELPKASLKLTRGGKRRRLLPIIGVDDHETPTAAELPRITWLPKKHPTVVSVGVGVTGRRFSIRRESNRAADGKKLRGHVFRWFCGKDASMGDFKTVEEAQANAALMEIRRAALR